MISSMLGNRMKMQLGVFFMLIMGGVFTVSSVMAQNMPADLARQATFDSEIMLVDSERSSIVVAEKPIVIVKSQKRNGPPPTVINDQTGKLLEFKDLNVGQKVFVKGWPQESGEIIATSVIVL